MRRVTATILACVLGAAGVLRSHLWPLAVLVLLGAVVGLLVAVARGTGSATRGDDLVRLPAAAAGMVLVLVGIGQLGILGLLAGLALLALVPAFVRDREHRS